MVFYHHQTTESFCSVFLRVWSEGARKMHPEPDRTVMGCCREQILGEEARSRVPDEYVSQLPDVANPPTLFLPIMKVAQSLAKNSSAQADALLSGMHASKIPRERWIDFLQRAWPRLLLWFQWFDRLQAGPVHGSYRCPILLRHIHTVVILVLD
jgi:hypothetical protein